GYDSAGNPTAITYGDHTSQALTFSYNELDQVLSMGGAVSQAFGSYIQPGNSDVGNLLSVGGTTLTYPTGGLNVAQPHAPASASGVGSYFYDANGNRHTDPTYTYTYDVENHLTALTLTQGGSTIIANTFDGDGARLVRTA